MKLGEGTTPGPWQLRDADNERCRVVIETLRRGDDIPTQGCDIAVAYWGTSTENANARLIAKAPLLVECQELLGDIGRWFDVQLKRGTINASTENRDSDFVSQIRALLAKLEE